MKELPFVTEYGKILDIGQPYNVNNGEELHACMSREDHEWGNV